MIKGAAIIMLFYFLGECISLSIGSIIPGSVCGMILLFLSLLAKWVKPKDVKNVSNALTQNMALFFVPAGVGLMVSYELIIKYWAVFLIVSVVTTAVIIAVVGYMQDKLEKKI
ncbi:CidA/LrgA family protein [Coprobacter tertius]|uniref:CidA/LrgA family protein n=1 Tax=Coprobacter tertius TaxID=2944915 RepID=A0ABT1MH48_9BACT|nr:CidA/LrgA family protein [Coprobacter tertius]MCP9611701.1 CidA/LrgA family protein [Coprobacter tertius]